MKSDRRESFLKWLNQEDVTDEAIPINIIRELTDVDISDVKLLDSKSEKQRPEITRMPPRHIHISRNYSVTALGEFLRCPESIFKRYYGYFREHFS